MFTARYSLSPNIKLSRLVFKRSRFAATYFAFNFKQSTSLVFKLSPCSKCNLFLFE